MKTLLLLRHAKSDWKDGELADHDRPLNKRGRRDAPRMGRFLAAEDLVPDLVVSSTAVRARDTANAVAEACGYADDVVLEEGLYEADPDQLLDLLRALPAGHDRVLVVGHNPGLELLVEVLGGADVRMPTGALARLDLPIAHWAEIPPRAGGRLVAIWRPKELGA